MTSNLWGVVCAIGTAVAVVVVTGAAPLARQPATSPGQAKPTPAPVPLPPVIKTAFIKAYPEATIKKVFHETEDGQEQYELESVDHGKALNVTYKPDGSLILIEQEVAAADVPAAVTAAITARYPGATMTLSERATEKKKTYYEIGLKGAPVTSVQLAPDGTWISPKPGK